VNASFPEDLLIVKWQGSDSALVQKVCQCYGVTNGHISGTSFTVQLTEDTGDWTADFVLAHELVHVLHVLDGRWNPAKRGDFEAEADGIAWLAITELRAAGVPPVFEESGTDAIRKTS